ncbi:Laminin subunit [Dirofilaria immitis]
MIDSDSDNVTNFLKDIDNMDEELFGRKKEAASKKGLLNVDNLFGDPQKEKKPKKNIDDFFPTKKPTVSFMDELSDGELQQREQATTFKKGKILEHPPDIRRTATVTADSDNSTKLMNRTAHDIENVFGLGSSKYGNRRGISNWTGKATITESKGGAVGSSKTDESGQFNDSSRRESTKSQKNGMISFEIPGYDRMQRMENEINCLNREIESLKRKQMMQEEALIEEWKEKMKRRERQFEEEFANMEENHRKQMSRLKSDHENVSQSIRDMFHSQIETLINGQKESKNYEEMLEKVNELIAKIGEVTINLNNQTDKSNSDQKHYISFREQQLEIREERIRKEEEWLANEKQHVSELNLKLQSLYDSSEQNALKEKWQVREERQKLNAEKEAFKNEQLKILDAAEQQKIEIEASKSNFLREQHDLIMRVMAAKSSLEAEKSAFDAQRQQDVLRLKMEAEQLDHKLKEVQNAEVILQNTQRIYEQKYQQLVVLERALIDECFELERCRKQLETVQNNTRRKHNPRNEPSEKVIPLLNTNGPDFITDPYIEEEPNRREKESYHAILKMHAGALESAASQQSLIDHK